MIGVGIKITKLSAISAARAGVLPTSAWSIVDQEAWDRAMLTILDLADLPAPPADALGQWSHFELDVSGASPREVPLAVQTRLITALPPLATLGFRLRPVRNRIVDPDTGVELSPSRYGLWGDTKVITLSGVRRPSAIPNSRVALTDAALPVTGGALLLSITAEPLSGGSPITHLIYRINGGADIERAVTPTVAGNYLITGLANDAPTTVSNLRFRNSVGDSSPVQANRTATPTVGVAAGTQNAPFGALTLGGAGAWRPTLAGSQLDIISATGLPTGIELVGGALVRKANEAVVAATATCTTALGDVPAAITSVPGARSVASVAEMQAAFQASAYGDHILLRTGDYGFARNLANTTISLGWASRPDWDDPNVTLHAGDPETDGDIVIRPHDGASPRIWQLNLGRLKHVELRDLNGFCSPNNSMKGAKKAVFWGCPSPRTGRNVTLTRCTVTGLDITSPEDGKLLPSAIRFDETWPNCAYIECRVEGGCFAAVNIPGPNCRIERGIFRDAYEDVMKGGGDHTGSRVLFNVFEKSVKIGSRTEVVSVRFYGPDATQRGPNDWVDIPNGNPGPDLRKGRIVLTLPAGGVSLWQGKFDNYDGRFGFLFVPSAPAGLEAALENIPKQRNQLKYDYQTWVNWQANSRWIYRLGGDLIELEYDAETVNVNALIALGEIETPGMILQASTAHADLWQVRNSPSAVSPDNNAPPGSAVRNVDSIDTHVIGNIMVSVGFTPGGDRADNGSLNGTHDNFNPISFWKDALFCGNVVSVSGLNGLKMSRGWEALIALNTCLPDPKDPAFVRKAGGSSSSAIIINDQPDSIGNPYDPTKQILISRNITQSIGTGTTTGGVDTGDNYRPGSVMNNPAAYAAWCEDNFVRYPNFGDFATGGTFNTYAEFMQAFKPLAGSPLAGFGAHSRPDLIDHATQTYDAEGLRALIAETRATPTLSDPTAVSDAVGEVVIGVTHAKAGGVLSWSLTTSATPPAVGSIGVLGEAAGSISGDAMIAPGTRTVERTGIPSGTYYAHWRQVDHLGQASAVATSAAVTVASSGAAMELRSSYFSPATGTGSKALHTADTMSAAAGLVVLAAMVRLGASSRTLSSISVQPKDGSGNNIGSALTLAGGQVSLIGIHSATDFVRVAFHQVTLPAGTASIDVSYNWSGSVRMAFAVLTPATGWSLASSPFASNGATWGTAGGSVSVTPTAADAMLVAAAWNNGESPTLTPGDALIAVTDLNPTAGQFVGLRLATPAATAAASAASGTNSNASAAVAVLRLNTI